MSDEIARKFVQRPVVEKAKGNVASSQVFANGHAEDFSSVSSSDQVDKISKDEKVDLERVQSEPIPDPVKVARAKRKGLGARFTLISEVTEPKHYPRLIKWFITFEIALAALAAPMGSTVIFRKDTVTFVRFKVLIRFEASLLEISRELHTSPAITNFSAAFYMLSMAIFPLWWSSFSETLGRRTIYLVSFFLFVIWNVLAAVSVNIGMLITMRILSGGAAASVQAVGAGTIADIWEVRERGHAMGMFYLGPLMGPLLGPVIGGVLAQGLGWRSTQWFLAIYGGVILLSLFFGLPEVLRIY